MSTAKRFGRLFTAASLLISAFAVLSTAPVSAEEVTSTSADPANLVFTVEGTEDWTADIEAKQFSHDYTMYDLEFTVVNSTVVGTNTQYEISRPDWDAYVQGSPMTK